MSVQRNYREKMFIELKNTQLRVTINVTEQQPLNSAIS